jgi:hypothetical protein
MRAAFLGIVASVALPAAAAELPRLVVMDLETPGLEADLTAPLAEYLLTEFQDTQAFQVTGGSDIKAMLEAEIKKQLVGCDDSDCLAQIAGALNAELLASSSVGKLPDGYLFNVKIIRVRDSSVLARASIKSNGEQEQLMKAMHTGVGIVSGTGAVWDRWPRLKPLPLALWGGAAAALGVGITFGLRAQSHYNDFRDPTYQDVRGAKRDGERNQLVANLGFGTAIAAGAAGLLCWWLGGERVEVQETEGTP